MDSFHVASIIGPEFVAVCLNWLGIGILVVQVYYYFNSFPSDQKRIRIFVWVLLLLELFEQVAVTDYCWNDLVQNWGNPKAVTSSPAHIHWSSFASPMALGFLAWLVQAFYAWRIWILGSNKFIKLFSVLILIVSSTQGILQIATTITFVFRKNAVGVDRRYVMLLTCLILALIVDMFITVGMLFVLRRAHNNGFMHGTNNVLQRLIILSVGTGAVLAVVGAITVVLFALSHNVARAHTWATIYDPSANWLGKLYSNSAMVSINARQVFRRDLQRSSTPTGNVLSLRFRPSDRTTGNGTAEMHTHMTGLDTNASGISRRSSDAGLPDGAELVDTVGGPSLYKV